jgi:hypothetical protein
MVVSMALTEGILYNPTDNPRDITIESFDISTAFLQGLDYAELQQQASHLGYEYRQDRTVYVTPPENVWSHFRKMEHAPRSMKIPDSQRSRYSLKCLRAMYGFADAPLMFQLALTSFLKKNTGAITSSFDDNYLFWLEVVNGEKRLILIMTLHVDDLQLTGATKYRTWIHGKLTARFGLLKRQTIPYTHAGIQLEWITEDCLRLHQDKFCEAMETVKIDKTRMAQSEDHCTTEEHTQFRSLTCASLWACQTRLDEICNVISLQTKLQAPLVKDLVAANNLVRRLKKNSDKFGLYYRRITGPFRIVVVTDASSANKTSSFATEGITIGIASDKMPEIHCDKHDYLDDSLIKHLSGKLHVLHVTSQKSKRISHSTSHAETLVCAKGIPMAQIIGLRLTEPEIVREKKFIKPLELQEILDAGKLAIPIDCFVDCMDLWELACGLRGIPQDKSQRLGVLSIREERRTQRIRRLHHIVTKYMLSDMLTKATGVDSRSLLELISSGTWTLSGPVRVRHGFGKV